MEIVEGSAQLDECRLRVAFSCEHGAGGTGGVRSEQRGAECGGHLAELLGGVMCWRGVARGENDLDVGGE